MSNKGATMLELVVAIAIVAITAVLVVPNVGRQIQKYRLKAATREMANYILETRTEAIKNGDFTNPVVFRVTFNQGNGTYVRQKYQGGAWADDGTAKTLPTHVTIGSLSPSDINTRYFKSDGTSVLDLDTDPTNELYDAAPMAFKIQLQNSKGDHYQVNLYSLTGTTDIQEGWN